MKRNWRNNIFTVFLLITALMFSCNDHKHAEQADTYTCPMHPTVISDKQGVCPVCGMDLVRKAREGEEVKITEELAKLIKSPNEVVASGIKTIKPSYKTMQGSIEALGIVTYDSRNVYNIPAKVGGRLEKVFLKYPFQKVTKGQKIAEVYSPELMTVQREFLFVLQNLFALQNRGTYDLAIASRQTSILFDNRMNSDVSLIFPGESKQNQTRDIESKCKESDVAGGRGKAWCIEST